MKVLILKIYKNLVLIISIIFILLTLLAILAPVFAHYKIYFLSDPIYWFFQWFCHQRPWRSYHMFDYQFALDARMFGIILSLGIGGLLCYIKKLKPLNNKSLIVLMVIMLFPMALDGTTQLIAEMNVINKATTLPFYESTNLIRSITGIFAGTGIAFAIFPLLSNSTGISINKRYIKFIILTLIISSLFIPLLVFLWSISSNINKPSSLFVDNIQRFPGYNYEITSNGGHSTIERYLIEPVNLFYERAKYFQKEEYLNILKIGFNKKIK